MWLKNACIAIIGVLALGACSQQEQIPSVEIGKSVPELELTYLQGSTVSITDNKNKDIHIIEFWATWCAPCKESAPILSALQKKYADKGLVVIGISDEDESVVKPYMAEYGANMAYTIALDPDGVTQKRYYNDLIVDDTPVQGIPWAFLIDRNGKLVWVGHPMAAELEEALILLLDSTNE